MGLRKTRRKQVPTRAHRVHRWRMRDGAGEGEAEEAAHFISEAVRSLARLARRHDFDLLSYLLSMTQLEAEEQGKRMRRRKLS